MSTRHLLDGSAAPVDLDFGARLVAPGLVGSVERLDPMDAADAAATRGERRPALDGPLARADFELQMALRFEVEPERLDLVPDDFRGRGGEEAMELEVPDLSHRDLGQVALEVDEAGAVTWHFPLADDGDVRPAATRGAGGSVRFRLRGHVPAAPAPGAASRGLLGSLGRKLVQVLVYPLTDPLLGRVSRFFAGRWEERNRPYLVRRVSPADYTEPTVEQLALDDWRRLAGGRALLFVHGTFSRCHATFGGLPAALIEELARRYEGRLFGFDHFTLSHDPEQNASWFVEQLPEGVSLDLDVVCHSRGGLVSRQLSERLDALGGDRARLRFGRLVHVAVPNAGTVLTDADRISSFLDRVSTLINLFPDNAAEVILESLLVVVKMVGRGFVSGLSGLAAMRPGGDHLTRLNQGGAVTTEYFALASDYEPRAGLRSLVRSLADGTMDLVFERQANDLVVPTDGVFAANGHASFPLPEARVRRMGDDPDVFHTNFFRDPRTQEALLDWLQG